MLPGQLSFFHRYRGVLMTAERTHYYHLALKPSYLYNRKVVSYYVYLVHQHPMETTRMIQQLGYTSEILHNYVKSHHEHYDGSGYPDRLKGEQIPLGARILSIANDFDVLTSNRKNQLGMNYQNAVKELQRKTKAGKYDPQCLAALTQILNMQTIPPRLLAFPVKA